LVECTVACGEISCSSIVVLGGIVLGWDMPVDALDLLGLFYSFHLFLSCWAGVAPCCVDIFANCTSRGKPFYSLLFTVLGLM
jgi:hypothetical protein